MATVRGPYFCRATCIETGSFAATKLYVETCAPTMEDLNLQKFLCKEFEIFVNSFIHEL